LIELASEGCYFFSEQKNFQRDFTPVPQDVADVQAAYASGLIASGKQLIVGGHMGEHGTREFLLAISNIRSNMVRDWLVYKFGLDQHSIETIGYGKERPQGGRGEYYCGACLQIEDDKEACQTAEQIEE